ncbi:helix-turn-helix domain-containing protein [Streptosporangium sp. NPDC020072]|uniref:winged helix-turn-helix transcriptional regulator n=1 Tax=Streptosporangium sp. NPDC020072 TaxID=3154788 RepID=UPI003441607F
MLDGPCRTFVSDCRVRAAAEPVGHVWDPAVISALRMGPTRRRELLTRIAGASDKVLTRTPRRLRAHGLVVRDSGANQASAPTGAVYRLSALGESFANGPLAYLAQWAADNQDRLTGEPTTS